MVEIMEDRGGAGKSAGIEVFTRHPQNPILVPADWPYPANSVFNPGATRIDGETLLLVRVEDGRGMSHLTAARSRDGIGDWRIDKRPTFTPDLSRPEESYGVEDPRVIRLDEEDCWAVLYTAYSDRGPLVSLALTKDFVSFDRKGAITWPDNKDAAFFPRKIGGKWWMIHRPTTGFGGARGHMWVSRSPDMVHWGEHDIFLEARSGGWWDANKIGLNAPPLETPEGWLILYHGVRVSGAGVNYRLGLALADLDRPDRIIKRNDRWIFGPREAYERNGDVGNVVFPCGWTLVDGRVFMYYGGADTVVGLATADLSDLLACLE